MKIHPIHVIAAAAAFGTILAQAPVLALPAVGSQAPLTTVKSTTGRTVLLGDRHSPRPVLINFFSTY